MGRAIPLPHIFQYDDYRAFLGDWVAARKRANPAFSYGVFARKAGIRARSFLKMAIDGERNLGEGTIARCIKGLGLSGAEADYFAHLVRWNQAGDPESRAKEGGVLRRIRLLGSQRDLGLPDAQGLNEVWSSYLVMGLSRVKGFQADPAWISRRLGGKVSPAQARSALRRLARAGILRLRGKRLLSTESSRFKVESRSGIPVSEAAFHARLLQEAADPSHHASGSAATVIIQAALTRERVGQLGVKIRDWLYENAQSPPGEADGELCVILAEIFPLSRPLPSR